MYSVYETKILIELKLNINWSIIKIFGKMLIAYK